MILPGCVGAGDGVVWPTPGLIYGDGVVDGAFGLYVGTCVGGLNGIYGVGFWETHTTDWQQKSLGSWVREHWGGSAAGRLPHLKYNFLFILDWILINTINFISLKKIEKYFTALEYNG